MSNSEGECIFRVLQHLREMFDFQSGRTNVEGAAVSELFSSQWYGKGGIRSMRANPVRC